MGVVVNWNTHPCRRRPRSGLLFTLSLCVPSHTPILLLLFYFSFPSTNLHSREKEKTLPLLWIPNESGATHVLIHSHGCVPGWPSRGGGGLLACLFAAAIAIMESSTLMSIEWHAMVFALFRTLMSHRHHHPPHTAERLIYHSLPRLSSGSPFPRGYQPTPGTAATWARWWTGMRRWVPPSVST